MDSRFSRPRIAVIGAGISGLSFSRALVGRGLDVVIFDKARGPGGRMSTRRAPEGGHAFDHGAQFFTARTPEFQQQVARWHSAGVVAPWTGRFGTLEGGRFVHEPPGRTRFVGTPRMSALTRHLSRNLYMRTGTRIAAMSHSDEGWSLQSTDGTTYGPFTAVVSTAPAPQTAPLLAPHSAALAARTEAAQMLPCFCLMLAFDEPVDAPFDAIQSTTPPLSWVARNSSKPGRTGSDCWVLHADPAWSRANLHAEPGFVRFEMLETFVSLTGETAEPRWMSLHRWRYARADGPFDPAEPCLWDPALGLGACGDWVVGGRVEAAWRSGMAMARTVLGWLREAATLRT